MSSEVVVSIHDGRVASGFVGDIRLGFSGDARVVDLLEKFGSGSDEGVLSVRNTNFAGWTRLVECGLVHGDVLHLKVASDDVKYDVDRGVFSGLGLVQIDGAERGKLFRVAESDTLDLTLLPDGDFCWTRSTRTGLESSVDSGLSVSTGETGGLFVKPVGHYVTLDGESMVEPREVLAGSTFTLGAVDRSNSGKLWNLSFQVSELGDRSDSLGGWVPYRVSSVGHDSESKLDVDEVRVPPKPSEPKKKSVTDYFFEYAPMLGMSLFFSLRFGQVWFFLVYAAIYAMRAFSQYQKYREAKKKYVEDALDWEERLERAKVNFQAHISGENGRRRNVYAETLDKNEIWKSWNRKAGLWSRQPDTDEYLHVWVGTGRWRSDALFPIPPGLDNDDHDKIVQETNDLRLIDKAPIVVDLKAHHMAVVGGRSETLRGWSFIVADIAANHSPLHVACAVIAPNEGDDIDEFVNAVKWLPHIRVPFGVLTGDRVVRGKKAASQWIQNLASELAQKSVNERPMRDLILFVHEASEVPIALLEECIDAADGKIRLVWCGSSRERVPVKITETMEFSGMVNGKPIAVLDSHNLGSIDDQKIEELKERPDKSKIIYPKIIGNVSKLKQMAKGIAPLTDERSGLDTAAIPTMVRLDEYLEFDPSKGDQTKWLNGQQTSDTIKSLWLDLGSRADSKQRVDLVKQGPHMLVGGTTGSGKSEFLQSLVASAIVQYSPAELNLALIDFKGGASFDMFTPTEHVIAEASNLDPTRIVRTLKFLDGELDFRMTQMRKHKAKDYEELRYAGCQLPRLLVVMDEYAAAKKAYPTFSAITDTIAARGRSLGIHVIFATQNPANSLTADMDTNIGARVCLRMLSNSDAKSVVEDPAPARISIEQPGRAFIKAADGALVEFQSPWATAPHQSDDRPKVEVGLFDHRSSATA